MFKRFVKIMLSAMCVAFVFAANANAAFAKTATYTAGQFTDVSEAEWYSESVKDAYEYGIMNGNSGSTFSPNGTLTVAEGITIASRIHAALGGETVLPAEGEWYMPYVNYAVSHGFMKENTFDSYDRNITRYEIAELLSDVCGDLPEINDISGVYDVPSEKILKLYKTGILTGNDEYGTFDGDANLKRSEISAMAVRIADSTKRVRKVLVQRPAVNYGDAYGIIENIRGYGPNDIANGWNYDNRFDFFNETGKGTMMKLDDTKTSAYQRLIRDFKPESEGLLKFEFNGTVTSSDDGAYLAFLNEQEERLLWLSVKEGYWYIHGLDTVSTGVPAGACNIEMSIDLDAGVAKTVINSVECPDVSFRKGTFTRLVAGTTKEGIGYIHAFHTMLSKNYVLLEHFLTGANGVGKTPVGWYIDGDFTIQKNLGMLEPDLYSVKSETKAGDTSVAYTYFTPISGLFTFQTAILLPEKVSGAKVSLLSGGREVLTIETKSDGMYIGEKMLNNYFGNVWQTLLVDGDTETGKATVRINGKNKGEFDFSASSFDGVKITFAPDKDAVMWFDDVTVNNRHEYADYPSYPQVAESTDYNIGINVCWLWRDQHSGEGWDAVSAFPEFDTYLGFYDEGIRETADWEIKLMAEHGIDFMHVCWYAPYANTTEPIKQMRHSYAALHDGYFNAEYSDLVDFCIMWENNSVDVKNLEAFKEYIWKYWVEYYFKDERYVRLDNKALLTVWNANNFSTAFGGDAGAAKAVAFMNEDIKNYGYDGIIVITNAGPTENTQGKYTWLNGMGLDGTYIYATTELDGEKQFAINKNNMTYAENCGMFHLPTIGVGFNDVGRNERRSAIISEQQHLLVCQRVKAALDAKKTGTFLDNTLMISTWNEWSEGHYVMPSASNGFSYLENIRKTFTKDTSDHTAVDAPLTEAQLARICRTYPEDHSPVRWFQNEASDIPNDFGDKYPGVKVNGTELNFTFLPVKTSDGDLEVVGEDRNNGFYSMLRVYHEWNRFDGELTIITRDEKTLTFTVGKNTVYVDGKPTDAGFTFKLRDGLPVFHIKKLCNLLGYPYTQDGEKVLVQAATDYEYKVLSSRVDYQWEFNLEGELEGWRAQGTKNLTVGSDGCLTGTSIGADPAVMKTVSLYSGDFSHVRIGVVYEEGLYDDSKPQLFYTTKSSGSYSADKCLNGIYVIPENTKNGDVIEAVFEFPENADLEITSLRFDMFGSANEYKIDYIRVTMEREKAPEPVYIEPKDGNRWTFDTNGDAQGWESSLPLTVQGGYLSATPINPDPYILRKVNFKYNDYHVMIVGVKNTGSLRNKVGYLYFTTDKDGSLSADKMISSKYRVPSGTEIGDTVEIVFDLSSNPKFNDT
ncbi:MAG: glycoside hydrolase family 99-like domain-containing protein, partial [Eubacteriales bacterium]